MTALAVLHVPCREPGADPDDWYEENVDTTLLGNSRAVLRWRRENARRLCEGCDLTGPCLSDALRQREREGIWGGLIADDIVRMARTGRRPA